MDWRDLMRLSPSRAAALVLAFGASCGTIRAATVTSVTTTLVMTRPDDGVLYSFPVDVDLTTGAGDVAGGKFLMVFQTIGGINIDGVNLVFPKGVKAGDMLTAMLDLYVGCRPNGNAMEIFGPLGGTGAANIMAQFAFANGQTFNGVSVACTDPAIQPNPVNGPKGMTTPGPDGSPPYVPGTVPEVPLVYASSVPEPSSFAMLLAGSLLIAVVGRRCHHRAA